MQTMISPTCGLTVHRIIDLQEQETESTADDTMKNVSSAGIPNAARKRKSLFDNDEEVARYRRVRIVSELQAEQYSYTDPEEWLKWR